jgi:hypothetical protein
MGRIDKVMVGRYCCGYAHHVAYLNHRLLHQRMVPRFKSYDATLSFQTAYDMGELSIQLDVSIHSPFSSFVESNEINDVY